jgi:hypothetical protein
MNVEQVKDYCANLIHASSAQLGGGRNILSYQANAKKVAYFKTSEPEQRPFSIKVTPYTLLVALGYVIYFFIHLSKSAVRAQLKAYWFPISLVAVLNTTSYGLFL